MKKLLITSLVAFSSFSAMAKNIHFAMLPAYPPFETINEKGEIIGFDIDLANAICREIQADCQFSSQSFDSLVQSVKQKRIDAAISAMDITDARKKQVAFTDAYYDSTASFIGLESQTDLANVKRLGVQNGTTFQQYVVAEVKDKEIKSYATIQDAVLDLKNGRIEALFGDTAVLAELMKKEAGLHFVGEKVTNPKYFGNGFGIAVNKGNKALLDDLNKGLAAVKANGEYQKIYEKWISK